MDKRMRRDTAARMQVGGDNQTGGIQSLARGLRMLRCFDVETPAWSLSDLSRHLGLNRGTIHRFLKTLEAEQFLTLDPTTEKYYLGPGAFRLGCVSGLTSELRRIARPHMEHLALECSEAVGLAVWAGDAAMLVDLAFAPRYYQPMTRIGQLFHDYRSAHNRVFLAFMQKARRDQLLARAKAESPASANIDFDQLAVELDRAAVEGVTYDLAGSNPELCVVGAPIRDATGQVRASMVVVSPTERFDRDQLGSRVTALKKTANKVSLELGCVDKSFPEPQLEGT